jgi:hypothetical protein
MLLFADWYSWLEGRGGNNFSWHLHVSVERFWHQNAMLIEKPSEMETMRYRLRTPAGPSPPPIKEPPSPPENQDAPVREPDPEEPAQI